MVEGRRPAGRRGLVQHHLRQDAVAPVSGGIGGHAGRHVAGLVALAPRDLQQALQARPAGDRHRGQATVVQAAPANPSADVTARVHAIQQVLRIAGAEHHHAGQRIAAIQGGCRPAQDLDALHGIDLEQVAPRRGELPDRERIGDRHAIDLHADPVAVEATDRQPLRAEARGIDGNVHPGLVAHQLGQVLHLPALDLGTIDHIHRGGHLAQRFRHLARHHHHAIQVVWCRSAAIRALLGQRGPGQCAGHGEHERMDSGNQCGLGHRRLRMEAAKPV